jgi:hypothetical protein
LAQAAAQEAVVRVLLVEQGQPDKALLGVMPLALWVRAVVEQRLLAQVVEPH